MGAMLGAPPRRPDRGPTAPGRAAIAWLRRVPSRRVLLAGGIVLVVLIAGLLAAGPMVRSRIAREAAKRHLEVVVGSVRPGFFAVSLRDVQVRLEGVPIDVRLDEVEVGLTASLSLGGVEARGGAIRVDGDPDDVMARLRDFRRGGSSSSSSGDDEGHRTPISVADLSFAWPLPDGGDLAGEGLYASRTDQGMRLGCARCSARRGANVVEVLEADVELSPDGALRRVGAAAATVAHMRAKPDRPRAEAPAAPEGQDLVPPPLPPKPEGSKKARAGAPSAVAAAAPPADEPVLPLPDLHALRQRIALVATQLGDRVPDGAKVDIRGLSVRLDEGADSVAVGPGLFTLERRDARVHLTFASSPSEPADPGAPGAAKSTRLALDAELPLGDGDVIARLSGGPVSLAVLGVTEGTKGLQDVGKGTVSGTGQLVLSSAGDALTFDGRVALRSISINKPRLSHQALKGIDFAVSARGVLDDRGHLRVDDAQLDMGALHVKTRGTVEETPDHLAVSLTTEVAPSACQALLDSAPAGLLPTVRWARLAGTFGASVRLDFDTRDLDKLVLDYRIDDACRIIEVPRDLARERFGGAFTYRTYHPDGTPGETTTGPGTDAWTDLEAISPYMVAAVRTTEDGAFYRHRGFNHGAIRSSVQANIKARRFVRGASTITMQLAKNLFLSREKTLSRKIEEVILTDYLEQVFQKDELMELYLNVVEFGPDVYGITRAAEHYFGRAPDELNLPECFFLATLLPSPVRYGRLREGGEVSEKWLRHLHALMGIAAKRGTITAGELGDGLAQRVLFVRDGDPRPEPRSPVRARHRDPYGDDVDWQPID
jgi:hypothetical protein